MAAGNAPADALGGRWDGKTGSAEALGSTVMALVENSRQGRHLGRDIVVVGCSERRLSPCTVRPGTLDSVGLEL